MTRHGVCSVDGCGATVHARGWCNLHYRRWLRRGSPLATAAPSGGPRLVSPAPVLALITGSDRQVAEQCGVTRRTIQRWRHGVTLMRETAADRIAVRLGHHPAELWMEG